MRTITTLKDWQIDAFQIGRPSRYFMIQSPGGAGKSLLQVLLAQADIEDTAVRIRTKFDQLKLVRDVLPLWGPVAGVILFAVGLLLLLKRGRGAISRAPAAAPGAPAMETGV